MTAGATSGNRFRSWPEMLANAARAAGGLRALGVAEDDSVALMLRNDFATFEVNMAAGQLGAYAVPINWHFTPEEAGYILADSRARHDENLHIGRNAGGDLRQQISMDHEHLGVERGCNTLGGTSGGCFNCALRGGTIPA